MHPTTEHLAEKLVVIEDLLRQHIASSADWRQRTDAELKANTEITQGIRKVVDAGGIVKWVIITFGTLAGALAGFWALASAIGGQNGG